MKQEKKVSFFIVRFWLGDGVHHGSDSHAKHNLHAYVNIVYVNGGVLIVVGKGEMETLEQHAGVNL